MSKAVELSVAGQRCRVVTSADEAELKVLTDMVESKLSQVLKPGRPLTTQAMILAAVALAHDVIEEKRRADTVTTKATAALQGLLTRVDGALAAQQDDALEVPLAKRARRARKEREASTQKLAPAARTQQQTKNASEHNEES